MDKPKERRRKSAKLLPDQWAALKKWIKDVTGQDVADICHVHPNTISNLSIKGQGAPETVETVLKNMPNKYMPPVQLQLGLEQ